jgi:hypothetical protein
MAEILRAVALVSIITFSITAAMVVVGTLGAIIAPSAHNYQATAQQMGNQTMMVNPDFDAILTGASEVPPVQTNASGDADLDVEIEDGQRVVDYNIFVNNIDRVTQAHIHQGSSNETGPIIVPLFNATTPTGPVTGQLTEGQFTSANFVGPLQGRQLDDLIALMQNGTAYVNVHTEQNPEGEIRGTVLLDDNDDDDEEGGGGEEEEDDDDDDDDDDD